MYNIFLFDTFEYIYHPVMIYNDKIKIQNFSSTLAIIKDGSSELVFFQNIHNMTRKTAHISLILLGISFFVHFYFNMCVLYVLTWFKHM